MSQDAPKTQEGSSTGIIMGKNEVPTYDPAVEGDKARMKDWKRVDTPTDTLRTQAALINDHVLAKEEATAPSEVAAETDAPKPFEAAEITMRHRPKREPSEQSKETPNVSRLKKEVPESGIFRRPNSKK